MKKQMGYANNKAIPFVAIIGEQEMTDGTVALKNMTTGEQQSIKAEELKNILA
jgi:histidyl-tRNA synthetase